MLVLTGVVAGLLSWPSPVPDPYFLPCWVTEFQSPLLRPNTAAWRDREAILAGGYFPRAGAAAVAGAQKQLLLAELSALARRPASDRVVVYLSAYAGTDEQDRVYLLPGDAGPANPWARLPLAEVLRLVRACPARHKLLVLDIAWPVADLQLGILGNDAVGRIPAELAAVPDPDRLVLSTCSPGQVVLASEELGRSVFGYYFEQALRGWADGFGPHGTRDGRVSVKELAAMVTARVDRWAEQNRGARQTPVLLGTGQDFDLAAMPHGRPQPPLPEPKERVYPKWLAEGWQLRGQWQADGSDRIDPRAFAKLEAVLLRAEREWRDGGNEATIQEDLKADLAHLTAELEAARRIVAPPEPCSLAGVLAAGRQPDPAVAAAVVQLLAKLQAQPPHAKPKQAQAAKDKALGEFDKTVKGKPVVDVALAVFQAAASQACPRPETIRVLDGLLRAREPRPRYVETLLLRHLAELAAEVPSAEWPEATVRRALEAAGQGERAQCPARPFARVRGLLDEAATDRHEAEYLLGARGYAPVEEADRLFGRAAERFGRILAREDALRAAYRCLDEAYAMLPAYAPYLEHDARYEPKWQAAVQAACQLADALRIGEARFHRAGHVGNVPHGPGLDDIQQKTAALRGDLDDLRQPFAPAQVKRLVQRCRREGALPETLRDVRAMLATSLVSAADRAALWKAGHDLARRLCDETLHLDRQEDQGRGPTVCPQPFDTKPAQHAESLAAARRARRSMPLLRLAGLSEGKSGTGDSTWGTFPTCQARRKPAPPGEASKACPAHLAASLARAWNEVLPERIKQQKDLASQDRLARLLPPFQASPLVDHPATNPTVRLHLAANEALWAWLAGRYRAAARDGVDPVFYTEAASRYVERIGGLPARYIHIVGPAEIPGLTAAEPTARCELSWRWVGPPDVKTPLRVRIVQPDDPRLAITPAAPLQPATSPLVLDLAWTVAGTLRVPSASDGYGTRSVPPASGYGTRSVPATLVPARGFLVEVATAGYVFHHKVALPSLPAQGTLDVLLSANPKGPSPPLDGLWLRPLATPQPFYLFVKNGTRQARNVVAELTASDVSTAKLSVAAGQTVRVKFDGPPPDPKCALPEIHGPLRVRLLDAQTQAVLADRRVPVRIADPRQYVAVRQIRFLPGSATKNQLRAELAAAGLPPGPPCFAELVLPPSRNPGLLAVKGGAFRGVLAEDGHRRTLYAKDLQLTPGGSDQGSVYFTVDGVQRALVFRATFARGGNPTTPTEEVQPALRLYADAHGRSGPGFHVRIEADYAPFGATLEVSLGRSGDAGFAAELTRRLPEARHHRIGFSPHGPGGALLAEAAILDWDVPLDTTGIVGRRTLRARLLGADGSEIRTVTETVTLGNAPPQQVQFVGTPKKASRKAPLPVKAAARESVPGVSKVLFFVGKPAGGKVPQGAPTVPGAPVDPDKLVWSAQLPPGPAAKGPTPITAQFTNGAGLSAFATTTVDLTDQSPVPPGSIRGTVLEGPLPQPGLDVFLLDQHGAAKAKTKTGDDGTFLFEGLVPGRYTASSSKPTSQRKGTAPATVHAAQQSDVTIDLAL